MAQPVIRQLIDRETYTYTYLLYDPASHQGVLIDPVAEQYDRDLKLITELGIELLYVLETHVHADHITSAGRIKQATGAQIAYGKDAGVSAIDLTLSDGESLSFGPFSIRTIFTPGHTNGCVSYHLDGYVFTGDALLIRGCGRTDFQQGNTQSLYHSVRDRLFSLEDGTVVFPAHDYHGNTASTIGEEKRWNPRLGNETSEQDFDDLMANLDLAMPKKINEAVPANLRTGIEAAKRPGVQYNFTMDSLHQVWEQREPGILIVDNRTPEEYATGHVPGSRNIPFGSEPEQVDSLRNYRKVYLYCHSGRRAQTAATTLSIMGLDNVEAVTHTGMPQWRDAGYPIENGPG